MTDFESTWDGLSHYARTTLDELERDVQPSWSHPQIWRALERRELIIYVRPDGYEPSNRGRALARWAHETGRSPS